MKWKCAMEEYIATKEVEVCKMEVKFPSYRHDVEVVDLGGLSYQFHIRSTLKLGIGMQAIFVVLTFLQIHLSVWNSQCERPHCGPQYIYRVASQLQYAETIQKWLQCF